MSISAIFKDGVFQPVVPLKLNEGERVQLVITRVFPQTARTIVSLKGIWKHADLSSDSDDWVTEAIADIRSESARKLEQIARDLSETLGRG